MNPGSGTASHRALLALPSTSHIVALLSLSWTAQAMTGVSAVAGSIAGAWLSAAVVLVAVAPALAALLVARLARPRVRRPMPTADADAESGRPPAAGASDAASARPTP